MPTHVTSTVNIPQPPPTDTLSRALFVESGISPEVAAERGYYSIRRREDFPEGFGKNVRRAPALGIPVRSPDGQTSFVRVRHGRPRPLYKRKNGRWGPTGKFAKYDQPASRGIILDVHPRNAERIKDPTVPLWVTEGEKKADCLTSRGLCAIALFGVDCWGKGGELLSDWQHVALNGRTVHVVYDSDVIVKPEVQNALERLVGALEARHANVEVVYLPDARDGSRQGVDDYLVAGGGTVEELYAMARPFEKKAYVGERLSRNKRLKLQIQTAWNIHDSMALERDSDYTRKAVYGVMAEEAQKHGKPTEEGPRFFLSGYIGALRAGVSQQTFSKHACALAEDGYLLIERPDDPTHANTYKLLNPDAGDNPRAVGSHIGGSGAEEKTWEGERGDEARESDPARGASSRRDSQVRAPARGDREDLPELRWSRTVKSWRVDDLGFRLCEADYQRRLGKRRGAILCYLVGMGPEGEDLRQLTLRFGGEQTRPRDFRRRWLHQMDGTDGGPVLVEIGEDGRVRAVEDWREALEEARTLAEEQEAHDVQLVRYELQREAFRKRNEIVADRAPTQEEMDEQRKRREERERITGAPEVSPLAAALREALDRNPGWAKEPPSWIAASLWAYDLYPGKPTRQEVSDALEVLGEESSIP